MNLSIAVSAVTANTTARTIGGVVCRYGVPGRTSAGVLRVRRGALRFPTDPTRVKLTREHVREESRGHLVAAMDTDPESAPIESPDGALRCTFRVADGPEGDAALREAADRTRDGLSFDIIDVTIEGDEITDGLVVAVGQVGIPAYDDGRIDTVAAALTEPPTTTTNREAPPMTEEQTARLAELRALETLTAEEAAEMVALSALEASDTVEGGATEEAPTAVAASMPSGVPGPSRRPATTRNRGVSALTAMARGVEEALNRRDVAGITAALSDVTYSGVGADVAFMPAWSGELWSGLQYESVYTPLLNSGDLTSLKGAGWRWVTKPVMADYAGDKAAIPSAVLATEPSEYVGARMAVGHDIDRAIYDFPDAGFIESYVAACRESWAMKLDDKVEAWIVANAVSIGGTASLSLLKGAARLANRVQRARLGRATFVMVNEDDHEGLMDVTTADVPAFLDLFGIEPANFVPSDAVAAGTIIAGVRNAATVRTLPGSPIRASAQHIANGGIDEAFFGYYAIEEHHTSAILKTTWDATP